jgi:hypothetical protein
LKIIPGIEAIRADGPMEPGEFREFIDLAREPMVRFPFEGPKIRSVGRDPFGEGEGWLARDNIGHVIIEPERLLPPPRPILLGNETIPEIGVIFDLSRRTLFRTMHDGSPESPGFPPGRSVLYTLAALFLLVDADHQPTLRLPLD